VNCLIKSGLDAVEASRTHRPHRLEDFAGSTSCDLTNALQRVPVIVVGCKADTIEKSQSSSLLAASKPASAGVDRLKRMNVNAQVLNELKKID